MGEFKLVRLISSLGVICSALAQCSHANSLANLDSATNSFYLTSGIFDDDAMLTAEQKLEICRRPNLNCSSPYRSFDGTCNNLKKPYAGSNFQCHQRVMNASFTDGISEPPKRIDLVKIFNAVQSASGTNVTSRTLFFMTVYQFIIHDLTETAISQLKGSDDCCAPSHQNTSQCSMRMNVTGALGYKDYGIECMSFVRAAACPCTDGEIRESLNKQSAYVDLSHVYLDGSKRDPKKPWRLLNSISKFAGELPSLDDDPPVCYARDKECFKGDARINQQQGLALHHIVFEKLHNQAADALRKLNPSWNDEVVFQEARKIVIGRYQYFYAIEFIGSLLKTETLIELGLDRASFVKGTRVNESITTATLVEAVHYELRAHFMVPEKIAGDDFFWLDSSRFYSEEGFVKRLSEAQYRERINPSFNFKKPVAQHMFKKPTEKLGMSMLFINIQRGRDVGMPNMLTAIQWATGRKVETYQDIEALDLFKPEHLKLLKSIYEDVKDVDLFVAGMLFKNFANGLSVVNYKIQSIQHTLTVLGDRFFFSHKGVFTDQQRIAIINSSSYSQLMCETLGISQISVDLIHYSENPELRNCSTYPAFQYSLWKV